MTRELRKDVMLFDLDGVEFRKSEALCTDRATQIPTLKSDIQRYYTGLFLCLKRKQENMINW